MKNLPIPEYILIPEYPKRTRPKFVFRSVLAYNGIHISMKS